MPSTKGRKTFGAVLSRRKGEHEGEHEEDINRGDDLGLYCDAVRLQLLRRSTTGHAYCQHSDSDSNADPNADSDSDSNANSNSNSYAYANSHPNANASPDADSNSHAYANADSHPNADARPRAYSATWDERYAESCHSGRSGSLDDRCEPDAYQSGARDTTEHRKRPLYRWIRQLPTGRCRLPDGRWIGHDLDTFYRSIQYDTRSVRRVLQWCDADGRR
jgi:hypothetical protein